ncbi:MAG: glycosyltransferase family 4 protein [Arcticibacter sp.]
MDTVVAISTKGFGNWNGGFEFLKFHVDSLINSDSQIKVAFVTPIERFYRLKRILKIILPYKSQDLKGKILKLAQSEKILTYYYRDDDESLDRVLQEINASVLYLTSFPYKVSIPVIGYIPDLQHVHLPEFFERKEIEFRNSLFKRLLANSELVIVNSKDTKRDLIQYFGVSHEKVEAVPFLPTQYSDTPVLKDHIVNKYSIEQSHFFHIPNQLWVHKDHITAIRALSLLKATHPDVAIVCTGNTSDFRSPNHINVVKETIRQLALDDSIYILGFIDKEDMFSIMSSSLAVIQPTLFEGGPGGGAAYEAVANGIPVILSNIPINREVIGENVKYFMAGDSYDLAKKMIEIIEECPARPNRQVLERNATHNKTQIRGILFSYITRVLSHSQGAFKTNSNSE